MPWDLIKQSAALLRNADTMQKPQIIADLNTSTYQKPLVLQMRKKTRNVRHLKRINRKGRINPAFDLRVEACGAFLWERTFINGSRLLARSFGNAPSFRVEACGAFLWERTFINGSRLVARSFGNAPSFRVEAYCHSSIGL